MPECVRDSSQVLADIHHPPQNALSPMQAELLALLERAMAATPWNDRKSLEQELIQLLAQKPVIPPVSPKRGGRNTRNQPTHRRHAKTSHAAPYLAYMLIWHIQA
jgi:hypothetical protein